MDATYISSQRYRNQEIVDAKRAAADYVVSYVEVEIEGELYRVVVDGHHSHAAALADSVEPRYEHSAALQSEADYLGWEDFLTSQHLGDDWYDVNTGSCVW